MERLATSKDRADFVACWPTRQGRQVKDWIPRNVDYEKDDDIFVSSLERVVTQFAASVVRRKHRVDIGKVFRMKDLEKRIDSL